jgi:quinol monooxygenase YgiN
MKTKITVSIKAVVVLATLLSLYSAYATEKNPQPAKAVGKSVPGELHQQQAAARLTRYDVKPGYQEQFREALSDYVLHSLLNESNIMAEAYSEQDNPAVLWLIERWTSKDELDKFSNNTQSRSVMTLGEVALIKPARRIYVKDLEPISKQQWRRTAMAADSQITIMLFVDAKPGTQQTFKNVYHIAMPRFRSEPGVVTYQLSQIEEDSTQFVTYEKFRSNDAFRYHLSFPPIQPVVDYLNTSIKKQPFQDGLHHLIEFAPLTRE